MSAQSSMSHSVPAYSFYAERIFGTKSETNANFTGESEILLFPYLQVKYPCKLFAIIITFEIVSYNYVTLFKEEEHKPLVYFLPMFSYAGKNTWTHSVWSIFAVLSYGVENKNTQGAAFKTAGEQEIKEEHIWAG